MYLLAESPIVPALFGDFKKKITTQKEKQSRTRENNCIATLINKLTNLM